MSGLIAATLMAVVLASLLVVIGVVVLGYRAAARERERWAHRVLRAQEDERAALARELHDLIVPALGGLAFRASACDVKLGTDLSQLAREVREISHGLYPSVLEHGGLVAALRDLADEWPHEVPTLRVVVSGGDAEAAGLRDDQADTVYRVVQAAVANAVQHAVAKQIVVEFSSEGGLGVVVVADDGRGWVPARSSVGLGWRTMQERAMSIGGRVNVVPSAEGGTRLELRFPMGAV